MKNITIKSLRNKQKDASSVAEKFFQKPKNEIAELAERPRKTRTIVRIIKFVFLSIFVLIVGGIGGILMDRFALPYALVKYPDLNQYEFLKKVNERTTVIETTKEVQISEDRAAVEAIQKVLPSVVHILKPSQDGNAIGHNGSGVIVTSDGFIVTSIKNITEESKTENKNKMIDAKTKSVKIELNDKSAYDAAIIGQDVSTGLAMIKIDRSNLPVLAFANYDDLKLGEKLVVVNDSVAIDIISKFINDYTPPDGEGEKDPLKNEVKTSFQKRIKIVNALEDSFNGSPAVGLNGEIIGISQGGDLLVPINEVERFINGAIKRD